MSARHSSYGNCDLRSSFIGCSPLVCPPCTTIVPNTAEPKVKLNLSISMKEGNI